MDALSEYQSREQAALARQAALDKRSRRIGNGRLLTALLLLSFLWLVFAQHWPAWIVLGPIALFTGLFVWHSRVQRGRDRAAKTAEWYRAGLARVQDRWAGAGATGERFNDPEQNYAQDIDLFGPGSLFQLLSVARTTVGEAALASWLLEPAAPSEVLARQLAAQELATALDLREDIALIGETKKISDPSLLLAWASTPAAAVARFVPAGAIALAVAGLATGVLFLSGRAPLFPFLIVFLASTTFTVWLRAAISKSLSGFETSGADLDNLSVLVERLEREQFHTPRLQQIRSALQAGTVPASRRISRLRRWIELFDSTDHILLRIINPVLLLRQHFAFAIIAWREGNGDYIQPWLQAVADFEALSSIAALTYERPQWRFPALLASATPRFEARSLNHALLPTSRAVPNDIDLGERTRLLIISGSNMSGKSTCLRAIGIAAVLAFAGAPVPAAELTLSPLRIGASLRTVDSLQDNRSRFMAELMRLRQIVELTKGEVPVLFLLDELLSGTNSHDRRIGASAIVRGLVNAGAIGLITTHDLALTAIGEELPGISANAHFTDEIRGGELHFDYRLRPGVVTHSNALELMKAVGLLTQ